MYNYDINVKYLDKSNDDELYKEYFLKVFDINEFDFESFDPILDSIYANVKDLKQFEEVFKIKDNLIFCDSNRIFFGLLFAYHSFEYFHICLKELKEKNEIADESINKLLKSLEYLKKN